MAVVVAQTRRFLWLIVAVALACSAAAVVARTLIPTSNKATVQVLIDPRGFRVFSNDLSSGQLDANAAINFVESQMGVIKSDRVLLRVVREQRVRDAGAASGSDATAPAAFDERDDTRALTKLRRATSVQRLERSFIIDVTVADDVPQRAAELANAVVKAYLKEDLIDRNASAKRLTAELTSRLEGLRQNLRESEDKVEAFRVNNGLVGVRDKLVIEQRLTEATTALTTAESREAQLRGKLSQLATPSSQMSTVGALGTDPESRSLALLLDIQAAARNDLEQLTGSLGEQHPTLVSARNRLNEVNKSITTALGGMRKAAQSQLEQVQTEVSYLSRKVTALSADLSKARQAEVGLRTLQADAEAHRKILESFETRSREAGEFGRIDGTNLRIISPARTPNRQGYFTGLMLWALIGGLVGAIVSTGVIGFAAIFQHNKPGPGHDPVPVPDATAAKPDSTPAVVQPPPRKQPNTPAVSQRESDSEPVSTSGMSIKALYKSCVGAGMLGFRKKKSFTVLVSSAEPRSGNSGIAADLARAAVAAGRHVLLVDANTAGPSLAALLPPDATARLIRLAGVLRPVYRLQSGSDELSIVPILKNERDVCLRLALRGEPSATSEAEFDFIVYDGPVATNREQASGLARIADRVVLVASSDDSAELSRDEIAGWFDVPADRILRTMARPTTTQRAA
jgi:uncharacterized protein involved in exopolysaccharide biosynthesis/Mrp family chromosome partitioning ATPase